MFPNQIPNPINQQNDGNKQPNMGNMGNMGNIPNMGAMPYYQYHFLNQQYPNQIPQNIKQNQVSQRNKKEPRKRASIVQMPSANLSQPIQNQIFVQPPPPPPPPSSHPPASVQMQTQLQESNANIDYPMKLMNLSDDRLDLLCQLFDIPVQHSRQGIINYFMSSTINQLCQNGSNLLNKFIEHLTNPNDSLMQIREPKIPRIFKQVSGMRSRYILLQFCQGMPFEFVQSNLNQSGIICIGQFVCDNPSSVPFGTVKINDREIMPVSFGEIGQYFLFGAPENINHASFQLSSTLIEHSYVWFVIHYLMPNHSFAQEFFRERAQNAEVDEQYLVRTTLCQGCPPFPLQTAIESTFHTGFISCPKCNKIVKFDQIKIEYLSTPSTVISTSERSNSGSANNSNNQINGYSNLMISPTSTQISRFNSGNSMGMIPMTPPQIGTPQQMPIQPQQQQQKKNRTKKVQPKSNTAPQPPMPMQMQMQMGMNNMNNMPSVNSMGNISNMNNINNMGNMNNMNNMNVMKNMHNMNNMMPMKNMNMMNMGMNVSMRNPVSMNPSMNMNIMNPTEMKSKQIIASSPQNSNPIPIVQPNMNTIPTQIINQQQQQQQPPPPQPPSQQSSQPLQQSSIIQQNQIQISQNISTPIQNQQPSQPPNQPPQPSTQPPPNQPQQQQQQQPQPQPQLQPPQPQKSSKQPKLPKPPVQVIKRKVKTANQPEDGEQQKNVTNKNLTKQAKQKQKSAKTQSQPPSKIEPNAAVAIPSQNSIPSHHTSSTPQFVEKQNKPVENVEEEEVIPPETPELRKARLNMINYICMTMKCAKKELDWKNFVYGNDSELKMNENSFNPDEYQDVDDYLDYIDSFM